jgi:hypothetical protein
MRIPLIESGAESLSVSEASIFKSNPDSDSDPDTDVSRILILSD